MKRLVAALLLLSSLLFSSGAMGPNSSAFKDNDFFNPEILKIDEKKYLGNFVKDVKIILEDGRETNLYSLLRGKPTILLLSYYTCEGTCPVRIDNLNELIKGTGLKKENFRVLNLSFDEKDTLESLKKFKEIHGPFTKHWTFGLIKKEQIRELTDSVGFKFFFSERDKTFVHPNVYIFVTEEGRITRYLYGVKPSERDIKLAILETEQNRISFNSIIDLAYLACFTYDPSRSRYVVNPTLIFAGIGFSAFGLVLLYSFFTMKSSKKEV